MATRTPPRNPGSYACRSKFTAPVSAFIAVTVGSMFSPAPM